MVLHGTDTMAYTASALSFLLDGMDMPVVLTGAQRPITSLRSDGRENLVTALQVAAGRSEGAPLVPEVTIFFNDVLLRGNRRVSSRPDTLGRLRAEPTQRVAHLTYAVRELSS